MLLSTFILFISKHFPNLHPPATLPPPRSQRKQRLLSSTKSSPILMIPPFHFFWNPVRLTVLSSSHSFQFLPGNWVQALSRYLIKSGQMHQRLHLRLQSAWVCHTQMSNLEGHILPCYFSPEINGLCSLFFKVHSLIPLLPHLHTHCETIPKAEQTS